MKTKAFLLLCLIIQLINVTYSNIPTRSGENRTKIALLSEVSSAYSNGYGPYKLMQLTSWIDANNDDQPDGVDSDYSGARGQFMLDIRNDETFNYSDPVCGTDAENDANAYNYPPGDYRLRNYMHGVNGAPCKNMYAVAFDFERQGWSKVNYKLKYFSCKESMTTFVEFLKIQEVQDIFWWDQNSWNFYYNSGTSDFGCSDSLEFLWRGGYIDNDDDSCDQNGNDICGTCNDGGCCFDCFDCFPFPFPFSSTTDTDP